MTGWSWPALEFGLIPKFIGRLPVICSVGRGSAGHAVSGAGLPWTVPLPAVQRKPLPQCPYALPQHGCPAVPRAAAARCPQAASAVRPPGLWCPLSGSLMSVGCVDPARLTSVDRQAPQPTADAAARETGVPVAAELDAAAVSAVRCCFRNRGRVSGRRWPPRTLPQSAGVRCYRKRSLGRRPLAWCRHRRYARVSWRCSRSPSWPRT
jgi:hypothetical protein